MSAFYVGQRVRVNRHKSSAHGEETVVMAVGVRVVLYGQYFYTGIQVEIPAQKNSFSEWCIFESHELEPILYDGMQPVAWSECLWQPESERVSQ